MKAQLQAILLKIDALSLRERLFLTLSLLAVLLALLDALWLTPETQATKKLSDQLVVQGAELDRLRAELRAAANPVDASQTVRDEIMQIDKRIQDVNADIATILPSSNGALLEDVLVQFLRKYEGLVLVGLTTTATGAVPSGAATSATPAKNALPAELSRRGLELKVKGPYPQLIAYLQKLENALPNLRWGSMELKSDIQPPVLTLQVFVLGVNPS